jgi:hypothetical protein
MKRRIHQNIWGNWNGYEGKKRVVEFGTDEVRAGHWLLTGDSDRYAAYESDETIKAARKATLGA